MRQGPTIFESIKYVDVDEISHGSVQSVSFRRCIVSVQCRHVDTCKASVHEIKIYDQ